MGRRPNGQLKGLMKVGVEFEKEIRKINKDLNSFLIDNGERKNISLKETTNLIFANNSVIITPEMLIKKGRKGKRLLFSGEIRI